MIAPGTQIGKYVIEREIGSGGFSTVYIGYNSKTKETHAFKCIDRKAITNLNIVQYVENELRIYSRLNHPNIAKCHDIIYAETYIMIVMEYMENGDMQRHINNNHMFRQAEQIRICTELLEALYYLHLRGISHRDIKPANIMFDKDWHVKLIDFGFCKENSTSMKTLCGTYLLMAPEVLNTQSYDGMKADIWSFAVTMHIMATGYLPFTYTSETQYIRDVKSNNLEFNIRAGGIIGWIIKNALQLEPKDRLPAKDLLEHIKKESNGSRNSLPNLGFVRRANTMGQLVKLQVPANSPIKIRSRGTFDNTIVRITTPRAVRFG